MRRKGSEEPEIAKEASGCLRKLRVMMELVESRTRRVGESANKSALVGPSPGCC